MTRLSVNINKIATLRNSRGGNNPNVVEAAIKCESFGAEGITVHPRPDERHIRYKDVYDIKEVIKTEFNIEGNPIKRFMDLVLDVVPAQATLVPDAHNAITSNQGWDTIAHKNFLKDIISELHKSNIRASVFINPDCELIKHAAETGADRIELYTEPYARHFSFNRENAVEPYIKAANTANECGLGINAGHDLNLDNLGYFINHVPFCDEVSIGHAIISDALYYGLENTIQMYLAAIEKGQ